MANPISTGIGKLRLFITEWMNRSPLGRRLAHGAFWSVVGSVASRALSIPASVALARLMGPVGYGELAIIQSSVELFAIFAGFGLSMTATKYVAELREKDPERAGRILALSTVTASFTGVVIAGLLFFMAPWLAAHTISAPHLTDALRIGAGLLFFASLSGAQNGALYGFEAFRTTAKLQSIVGFINIPFTLGGYLLWGLKGVLWGMMAGRMVEWLLRHLAVRAEARRANVQIRYRDCARDLPVLWRFSLPALVSGALVFPVNWACAAMLVNQPDGYTQMGIYNAANTWYNALLFLPVTLGTALLPLLSERMGHGDTAGSAGALRFMLKVNAIIMVPCVIGLSLASPYIMRMYGPEYSNAWPTLVLVIVTAGVFAVLMPIGDVIAASGRIWLGCGTNAGWAVVLLSSSYIFIQRGMGSVGLASARLVAYSIHAIWTFMIAYSILRKSRTPVELRTLEPTVSKTTP